jgi:hypothetical protein
LFTAVLKAVEKGPTVRTKVSFVLILSMALVVGWVRKSEALTDRHGNGGLGLTALAGDILDSPVVSVKNHRG